MPKEKINQPPKRVMVCVTGQRTCERLIEAGKKLTDESYGELFVVHAVHENDSFLGQQQDSHALNYLFELSKTKGASVMVLRTANILSALSDFSKENKIDAIVLGASPEGNNGDSFAEKFKKKLHQKPVQFFIVEG